MTMVIQGKKVSIDQCHRCGGLMVPEQVPEANTLEWRCVICGERVDAVILAHRRQNEARREAEELFSGAGKARLN